MRSPALLAVALLAAVGLSGCDLSKLKDPQAGAQNATTQSATTQASTALASCPSNTKMVCQPLTRPSTLAAPSMTPEKAKAPAAAAQGGYARKVAWRASSHHSQQVTRRVITERRVVVVRRYVDVPRQVVVERPVVERHVYADTYVERTLPPPREYARPSQDRYAETHVLRQDSDEARYRYERESSDQGGRYDQGDRYSGGASYERRESSHSSGGGYGSSSSSSSSYERGYDQGGDCGCRTPAAGRDRQGFLTWPGKR